MSSESTAIENYLQVNGRINLWGKLSEERDRLSRKSFAQQLARSATRSIEDRRKRAEVKTQIYNHLLPVLDQHAKVQCHMQRIYRKLMIGLSAASGVLLVALMGVLLL